MPRLDYKGGGDRHALKDRWEILFLLTELVQNRSHRGHTKPEPLVSMCCPLPCELPEVVACPYNTASGEERNGRWKERLLLAKGNEPCNSKHDSGTEQLVEERQMRTIGAVAVLFIGIAVHCYGAGDPVSSLTSDEKSETTTFRRDGKTILKSILYHSTEPKNRVLVQRVIFHDQVVVDLSDFQGKRAFVIHPTSHVSVSIQQDASTGALESVGLMDDSNVIIECFEVRDSRLTPVSGKQLELDRAATKDVGGLLAPDNVKKTTPEDFGGRVKGLVKKYKTEKSAPQEGSPSNDKPPPQDPSPSKKQ